MKNIPVYIGTYTTEGSEGIYQLSLDIEQKTMKNTSVAAAMGNPTYLVLSQNKKYLYSVAKVGSQGGVAAFSVEENHSLKLLNYYVTEGAPPCHVSVNASNTLLFSGNYHKGTVDVYLLNNDGSIQSLASSIKHSENEITAEKQAKTHVHCVLPSPDEKYLYVVDLGMNALITYEINNGTLHQKHLLPIKQGSGPRHLVFHHEGNFAYLFTESSSEVIILAYDKIDGSFEQRGSIFALPKEYHGENSGGAIRISPNGKFLYVSNRGHDSIAVFQINNKNGKLSTISHTKTGGKHPRDFAIDPTGQFLIVANKDTNNLVLFEIDKHTGELTKTGEEATIPNPVCVTFLT